MSIDMGAARVMGVLGMSVAKKLLYFKHKYGLQLYLYTSKKQKMTKKYNLTLDGSEQSMIPIIKNEWFHIDSPLKGKEIIPLEEFSAGTGISDLTLFTVDSKVIQQRRNTKLPAMTSMNEIDILARVIDTNGISINDLEIKLKKISVITLKRLVSQMIENQILIEKHGVIYANEILRQNATDNIVAIEAKVSNWKSGIRQAMRYKKYADYSYLAIYESHIKSCLNNLDAFERLGIGLIGVSDDGIKLYHTARYSNRSQSNESRLLAYERFLSVAYKGYEPFEVRNNFIINKP